MRSPANPDRLDHRERAAGKLGIGGWLRSLGYAALALASAPLLSAAIMRGMPPPSFARVVGRSQSACATAHARHRHRDDRARAASAARRARPRLRPRYKDFPSRR